MFFLNPDIFGIIRKQPGPYPTESAGPVLKNGLVGRGSECFGFDDEISMDHDYGPSFCVWLPGELYKQYGEMVQTAYDKMPADFLGVPGRVSEETGKDRVGVLCLEDFYYSLLGIDHVPETNLEWLRLQDENLATATNGVWRWFCKKLSSNPDSPCAFNSCTMILQMASMISTRSSVLST